MMTRDDMSRTLERVAQLLDLKGENPFKSRAYRMAAEVVRGEESDLVGRAVAKNWEGMVGSLGSGMRESLHEMATTGGLAYFEELRAEFPETIFELFEISGLGPKKIQALWGELGVGSCAALREVCESGRVAKLAGFGAKTQEKLLVALAQREEFASQFRLGEVSSLAEEIREFLRGHPEVNQVEIAGSYRRSKEVVSDLDFLVATKEGALVCEDFSRMEGVVEVIACGATKASVRLKQGLQCDLRAVSSEEFPFALQYFTGSKEHNVVLRKLAQKRGWSLNEYGLWDEASGARVGEIFEESEIYRELGLAMIEPELRENRGEVEAAEAGTLPKLVNLHALRGTFHNHTTSSDGKHTLEEMAAAAQDLGLSYLGIADHSRSSVQANGLDEERLLRQVAKIRELNAGWGADFALLAGSEVDILKDGSLDFADEILAQLDYCVASVHSSFQIPGEEMTARVIRAMENPHVTMLGHMTGRLLLRRDAYAIDHEKIIDCAAETKTIIELNCNPRRLDMDWRWWRRARDLGVLCAINPDAHHREQLAYLALGVRLARKGWLRREDVVNTRSLAEIREFLARPKVERN